MSGRIKIKSSFLLDIVEVALILILVVMLIGFASKTDMTGLLYLIMTVLVITIWYIVGIMRYNYKMYVLNGYLFVKQECLVIANTTYKVRHMCIEITDGKSYVILRRNKRIIVFLQLFGISEQKIKKG